MVKGQRSASVAVFGASIKVFLWSALVAIASVGFLMTPATYPVAVWVLLAAAVTIGLAIVAFFWGLVLTMCGQ